MMSFSGAQNAYGFSANLRSARSSLPDQNSITYQGIFSEHSFPTGDPEDTWVLNVASYAGGRVPHWSRKNESEIWVATFLKSSLDGQPRGKQPIDIMIAMDISGSMSSWLEKCSRIDMAKQAVLSLLEKLRPNDGFGFLVFNHSTIVIQQIENRSSLKLEELNRGIEKQCARGGTNLDLAMRKTLEVFKERLQKSGQDEKETDLPRERRIVFLTDMHASGEALEGLIEGGAEMGVHTTIIGIGMEFNADLSNIVTRNRGATYHCVTKDAELKEVIADEFQFNFFPCCFDAELTLSSDRFDVAGVYGTSYDTKQVVRQAQWTHVTHKFYPPVFKKRLFTFLLCCYRRKLDVSLNVIALIADFMSPRRASLTEIDTVFPSAVRGKDTVGGLILMKLTPRDQNWEHGRVELSLTFTDPRQKINPRGIKNRIVISNIEEKLPPALEKGILLQRYVELCRAVLEPVASLNAETKEKNCSMSREKHIERMKDFSTWLKTAVVDDRDGKLKGIQENLDALIRKLEKDN